MSLRLEEEKLRLQEIEAKKSNSAIIRKGVVVESSNAGEKDVDVKVINRNKQCGIFLIMLSGKYDTNFQFSCDPLCSIPCLINTFIKNLYSIVDRTIAKHHMRTEQSTTEKRIALQLKQHHHRQARHQLLPLH